MSPSKKRLSNGVAIVHPLVNMRCISNRQTSIPDIIGGLETLELKFCEVAGYDFTVCPAEESVCPCACRQSTHHEHCTAGAGTNAPDASRIICDSKRRCQDLHAAARSRRRGRPLGDSSRHTVAAPLRLLPPGHVLQVAPAACAVATMAVSRHRHLCCRLLDMLIFSGQK